MRIINKFNAETMEKLLRRCRGSAIVRITSIGARADPGYNADDSGSGLISFY